MLAADRKEKIITELIPHIERNGDFDTRERARQILLNYYTKFKGDTISYLWWKVKNAIESFNYLSESQLLRAGNRYLLERDFLIRGQLNLMHKLVDKHAVSKNVHFKNQAIDILEKFFLKNPKKKLVEDIINYSNSHFNYTRRMALCSILKKSDYSKSIEIPSGLCP